MLEHTPAVEPLKLSVLEAKAAEYRGKRWLGQQDMHVWNLTVTKDGRVLPDEASADQQERPGNELLVRVTKDNHQVYYQGLQVKLPSSYGGQEFYQVVTEKEFLLVDPRSGQVTVSFPLPLVALRVRGRFIASYTIRGVYLSDPTPHWRRKHEEHQQEFARRGTETPEVFPGG